jgi:hypothetical protein
MDQMTFDSGFTKREFVVTTPDDRFPQDIKLECVKDKCALLDRVSVGQNVKVTFDLRGNEYNGRYFVNLTAWRVEPAEASGAVEEMPPMDDMAPMDDSSAGPMPF